jgi:hypothetical protein
VRRAALTGVVTMVSLLGLAACGAADQEWRGTVRDSAGVEIVTNTGAGVWARGEAWTVAEVLRIGTPEGEAMYQFGQIVGLDVGPDGRIYVMDQQAQQVRVFGPDGRFLRGMGRAGSGPGELSQAAGPVFVGPGDTVSVPDIMLQRITLYTGDGDPAGSVPMPMTGGIPTRWLKAANHDVVQQSMIMAMPGQENVEQRNLILRRDSRGAILDTMLVMPVGETMDFSGTQPRITLFAPEPIWALGGDDRLIYGNNSEFRLRVSGPDGNILRIVEQAGERRPLSQSDQAEFRKLVREAWEATGAMPPQAIEVMSQALSFASHYPAYANLLGGPHGTIWVQRVQTPDIVRETGATFDMQDWGGPTWDVFGEDGRYLGEVTMPPRFTPFFIRDDRVYGVIRDDLDVQYVMVLSVVRPRGA